MHNTMPYQMHLVIIQHAWVARAAWLWQLPSLVSCAHASLTWCIHVNLVRN